MVRSSAARMEPRMLEPVAQALIARLLVPKVYFEAHWPRNQEDLIDMVLIDRSGTGDVHLVQLKPNARAALSSGSTNRLIQFPANYLWLAFPRPRTPVDYRSQPLYPDEGAGRIGIIEVAETDEGALGANVVWPAERFHERLQEEVKSFVRGNKPDISFR